MSRRSRFSVLISLSFLSGAAFGADPLTMEIVPALEAYTPSYGTIPIAVQLKNDGPDARGIVRVSGEGYQMDYPVELPRGAEKRLLTYPNVDYAGLQYVLMTNRGNLLRKFQLSGVSAEGTATVLLISDTSGEMSFLRGAQAGKSVVTPGRPAYGNNGNTLQDAYTNPSFAPDRAVGYANISGVVLGGGAERLNDEQVHALKLYALSGGCLVFIGGASAPVLEDARWRDLLPAKDFEVKTIDQSSVLESLGGYVAPRVSVTSGTPIPGAAARKEGSVLVTSERQFGLGKIVYLAFNPFEPPLSKWEGRRAAVNKAIRAIDSVRAVSFLGSYSSGTSGASYAPTAYVPGSSPGYYGARTIQNDPFSTKLPPTERVFFLLGAYFIVVVPLNFLVLKKLKRGELAWFTAPIISLGFASLFFASAQDLYSARMSTASQGILLGQEGMDDGLFIGQSQLFIPRGGVYDLKMEGIDSLGVVPSSQFYYGGGRDRDDGDLNPIDTGEVRVPQMQANNLAFRRVEYRQKLPVGRWFDISIVPDGRGYTCRIRNQSPYILEDGSVFVGEQQYTFGKLDSGQTKSVSVLKEGYHPDPNAQQAIGMPQFLSKTRGIAITGLLKGLRPGPQLGAQVDARSSIRIAYVAKEALGPQ